MTCFQYSHVFRVYDENVQIEFLQFEAKLASLTYGNPCLRNIVSNNENVLFILCNDQAQVRAEFDQVEGTINISMPT